MPPDLPDLYDMMETAEQCPDEEPQDHICRKCGKTGLWWDFAPGQLAERVLWGKRLRGHNGPHRCEFTNHFEDET